MIKLLAFSIIIVIITIVIHALGTSWMIRFLYRKLDIDVTPLPKKHALYALSFTAGFLILLHLTEIILWAFTFLLIPDATPLTGFEDAVYFSMITYTTVGYGDITLAGRWRLLSGFEAMNGILLFGWSSAMFFALVQRILGQMKGLSHIIKKP